jgi:hypothetical protein
MTDSEKLDFYKCVIVALLKACGGTMVTIDFTGLQAHEFAWKEIAENTYEFTISEAVNAH